MNGYVFSFSRYKPWAVCSVTEMAGRKCPDCVTDWLWAHLSVGLSGKSASLRIDVDGRAKRWIATPYPFLRHRGKPGDAGLIPTISIYQVRKYLEAPISPLGTRADVADKLKKGLWNPSSAPLKPQQRMYCLSRHLIPALYHQLTLAPYNDKYLWWIDRLIRSAVRSWLKLPKDTPTAFFHVQIADGGHGIPLLTQTIPLFKQKRIAHLRRSGDPVAQEILAMPVDFKKKNK